MGHLWALFCATPYRETLHQSQQRLSTEQPTTVGLQRCFAQESNNRQRDSERSTTCGLTDIFPRKGLSPVRQAAVTRPQVHPSPGAGLVRGCPLPQSPWFFVVLTVLLPHVTSSWTMYVACFCFVTTPHVLLAGKSPFSAQPRDKYIVYDQCNSSYSSFE